MKNHKLVWLDLEMTGLAPEKDKILEIASIVTDLNLNILAEGPNIAIHQPTHILETMDDWCISTHNKSGLISRVKCSEHDTNAAEMITLDFLQKWTTKESSLLCGNSIWVDRMFLYVHMPELESFFHHRLIDVTTIKELIRFWHPDLKNFKKANQHLALDDIRESVAELQYYQKIFFHLNNQ